MNEKTMVKILQHTQHDLLNKLQVIQGYLSMDKIEMVKTKLAESIDYYEEERKLLNLHAPHFILWISQFNHSHDIIELSYHIHPNQLDLSKIDLQLVNNCKQIIHRVSTVGSKRELYNVHLELIAFSLSSITVRLEIEGHFEHDNIVQDFQRLESIRVKRSDNGVICEFTCNASISEVNNYVY